MRERERESEGVMRWVYSPPVVLSQLLQLQVAGDQLINGGSTLRGDSGERGRGEGGHCTHLSVLVEEEEGHKASGGQTSTLSDI